MDPRTVILIAGFMVGLMSVVMFSLRRNYPRSIGGLREWALGLLTMFASGLSMVVLERSGLPLAFSVGMPNMLLLTGALAILVGLQRFLQLPPSRPAQLVQHGTLVVAAILMVWFTTIVPSYAPRILTVALIGMGIFASAAWLTLRHGTSRFSNRATAGVFALLSINHAIRLYTAVRWPAQTSLFEKLPQNVFYITMLPVLALLLSIGFVLMATDRLRHELELLSIHDVLTGVLTRRAISQRGEQELAHSHRTGDPLAVLYMDLDHFKTINDSLGHAAGDRVLEQFANCAHSVLRESDSFGRFGGEEFVALLPHSDAETAAHVAERLRATWEAAAELPRSTISVGVAVSGHGEVSIDTLLNRADSALYRAKRLGRNRVVMAVDEADGSDRRFAVGV